MCHKREAVQGSVAKVTAYEIAKSTYLHYTWNMIFAVKLYFRVSTLTFHTDVGFVLGYSLIAV